MDMRVPFWPRRLRARSSLHRTLLAAVLLGPLGGRAQAADLSGKWQIQSMGTDRELVIRQQGNQFLAYRVLWPQFEGEKYKLEHLYRGKVVGDTIQGKLLVREEELPEFEVLRSFTATIASTENVRLDGLPIVRLAGPEAAAALDALALPKPGRRRPTRTPGGA